jgi:hypothetical protein
VFPAFSAVCVCRKSFEDEPPPPDFGATGKGFGLDSLCPTDDGKMAGVNDMKAVELCELKVEMADPGPRWMAYPQGSLRYGATGGENPPKNGIYPTESD